MKKEKDLYKEFKKHWNHYIERIEPKGIGKGTPDVVLCKTKEIRLELKVIKYFDCKKLPIRESQKLWFIKYPGNAFILFKVDDCFYLFKKDCINELCNKIEFKRFMIISCAMTNDICNIVKYLENY